MMASHAQADPRRGLRVATQVAALRGLLLLPAIALIVALSFVLRILASEGFFAFPYSAPSGVGPLCCPNHAFPTHTTIVCFSAALAFAGTISSPVAAFMLRSYEGRRPYGLLATCIGSAIALGYVVFGSPWGFLLFD
jgi:hypothetical protein